MAVNLIVEDGSGLPNANSYISLDDARIYAESRGIELSDDDQTAIIQLIQGADFLNIPQFACQYAGTKLNPTQALAWPRVDVFSCNGVIADGTIPTQLKYAQVAVAGAIESGVDLYPNGTTAPIKRETVGPLTTEYDVTGYDPSATPQLSQVNNLISGLFARCECSGGLRTFRV
jgi:DnaT-like ssDNA binding protein